MKKQDLATRSSSKDLKVKSLKLKQDKWMAERSVAHEPASISSKPVSISRNIRQRATYSYKTEQSDTSRKQENNTKLMRWSVNSNTPSSDEFVVRKVPNVISKSGQNATKGKSKKYLQENNHLEFRKERHREDLRSLTKQNIHRSVASSEEYDIDDISSELETVMSDLDQQSFYAESTTGTIYSPSKYGSVTPDTNQFNHNINSNSYYPSHYCPCCKEVMNDSCCSPMLVIPCGHSVCSNCLNRKSVCPQCNSKINSSVENAGLKEIIASHKETIDKERTRKENEMIFKYKQEYDSLKVRSTVLQDEAQSIVTEMKGITDDLLTTRSNMDKIQQEAKSTKEKIKQLKEKLQENESKYLEQNSTTQKLDIEYKRKQESLSMVEDTLSKIKSGKEKIKLIVSDINPNIDINTWQSK